ncbi:hypothetical protein [Labedaea rhizosphaerae]|uniref:Uncharacterized protein n=1 Tax=Labedaea rhizosphaerae TaxID=598644 RepID=A0A4R6SMQ6_LABRH|nr:hypothetical protein [Labedaea rhizosphaerae]TDQ05224.1 hypothetical protein EV186_1011192 [Labedaea rhizosphaerae]
MHNDPALAEAANRARFITTIVVGVSLLLDVFAAFVGGDPGTERNGMLMAVVGCVIATSVVFAMPAMCFYYTFMARRAGTARKPVTASFLILNAVMPLSGVIPAWIIALALGLRVIGIAAAVATVLAAALLWPTEKRLDLVVRGEAKVLFPVQSPA